jgi:hypothetical protein
MPGEVEPGESEVTPLDSIAYFLDINEQFVQAATHTVAQPSDVALGMVNLVKKLAVESTLPMFETKFYGSIGDEQLVTTATGAVMNTTEKLWKTATKLRPDDPSHFGFQHGLQEFAVRALINVNEESDESQSRVSEAMELVCNTYEGAVQNLFEKVMTADSVVVYAIKAGERDARKQQLRDFGSTALATFIGTGAAYYLLNKKKG